MATYRNKPLPLIPFQFLTSEKSEIGQQQEACRPLDFDLDMDAPHCSRDLPKTVNNKAVLKAGIPSWCGKNWGEAHFDNIDHGLVPRLPEKIGNEESPDGPPDTKTTTVHHGQKQELLFTCLPLRLQGAMKEDVEEEKAGAKPCSSTQQEKAEVAPHEHKDNIIANCTIADSAIGKSIIETHNIGGIGMEVEVTRSLPSHTSEKIPHMPSSLSSPSFMVQSAERDSNGHTSDTGTLGAVDNAIVSVSEGIALEDKIQSTNTNIELQPPPQPSSFSQLTVSLPGGRMNSFRFPPRKDPIESQPHLQQPPHARTRQYHHLHHQSLPPIYARRSVSPLLLSRIQSPSAASPSSLDSHHRSTSTSVATVSSVSSSSCSTCACKLTNVSSLLQNHACDRSTIETIDGANGHLGREDSNTAARQSLTEETDTLSQQPQQQQKQQSEYQQTTQQKQRRRSTLRRSESCHLVLRSHRPTLSFNSSKDALLSLQARRINKPDAKVLRLPDIQTTATSNSNINTTAPTTAAVTTSPVQPKVTTSYPKNGGQPSVTVQTSTNLTIVKDDQTNSSSESCVLPQEHLILNSQEKLIKSQDGDDDDDDDDGQEDYQLRVSDRDRTVTDALLVEMTTLDAFKADSTAAGESTSTTPTPTTTNTMAASSLADQSTLSEDVCSTMGNITKVNKQVSMATRSPIEEDDGHIANLENAKATAAMSMATLATETPDITSDAGEIKRFVKRSHALCELETTEETYVDDLDTLIHVHLRVLEMRHWFPQALHGRLVRCCHELLKGQRNFLSRLAMVKMAETDHERAPLAVYRNMTEAFDVLQQATHLYAEFCELRTRTLVHLNKHAPGGSTLTLLQKEGNDLLIQQGRRNSRADLKDYLIKPIQRVCRYPLLLREILRLTQVQDPEHGVVVQAYDQMREMAQAMDEAQRAVERMMLTERFLKKIPESTPPPRKVATGHGGTNMAALVSSVPILMDVGRGPYYHEGNGYFEDYKGEDVFMTAGGGDIVESQEGIAPSAITKTMLSESAGSIVLAGALEYVLTPNVPIRLKYYGCFLFETMLVIVKPKKSNQYEIRQWLPLRFCEIHETTRLDGYTRFGWRIVFDQFGIDFGASSSSEQQVWITTLQSRIQAAKEMHEFALRDGVKSAPISSSLPWGTPSSLVYVPRSTYSRSNNSNTGSGSRRYSGHVRPSSMATVSGGMTPSPSPWSACSSAIPSPLMPPPPAGQTTHTTLVMAPPLAGFGGDFSGDGESGRGWDMLGPESALANYANGALDHHFMHNNNNQAQTPGLSGAKYSSLSRTDISISSASISTTGDQRGGTSKSSTATSPSGATIRIGGMAGNSIGSNYSSTSMLTSSVSGNSHDQDATCLSMASHPHHHHHQQQQQQQQPNSSHYHQPHNAPVSDYQYRIQSVPQQKQQQQQQQQQYMSYPTAPAAMSIASAWLMAEQRSRSHSFDVSRVFTSNTNNVIKPTQRTLVQNLFKDVSSENVWTTATSVQQSSGSNSSGTNGSTAPSASNSTGAITTATSTSITTTTNNNCVANSSSVSVRGAAVGGGDGIPGSASLLVHSHTGVMSGMTSSVSASTLSSCNSTRTTIGVCDDEENGCQATVAPPGTAVSSSSSTTSLTSRLLRRRDSGSNCGGSGGSSGNGSGRIPMPNATVNIIQERNDWDRRRSSATAAIAATLNLNFRSHKNQNQNTTNPSSVISSTPHSRSNILGINHQQQHHHHHHSRHTHDMSMSTTTMDQAPNTIGTSQTVPPKPVSLQNQNHQDNSVKSRAQFFEKRSSLPVFASSDLLYSSSSSHATTISTTATTTKAEAASATAVVAEVEVAATGILPNATRASMVSAATTGRQSSLQAPPPASSSSSSMKISRMEIGQSPMISFNAKTRHHHTASEEVAGGSGSTVPIVVYDPAEYLKNDDDKTQGDDEECEVDREQMKVNKVGKEDKDEEEEEDVDLLLTSLNSAGEAARSRRSTRGLSSRGSSPTFASSSGLSSSNNNDEDDDRKRRKGHDSILSVMEIPAIYSPVPVPAPVHVSASALSPFKDNGQHETSCQYPQARQRQQSQQQSQQQQQQQQQQPVLPNKDGSMEKKLWSTMGRLTQKQKKISTRHSRSATFNQDSESIESAFGGGVEDNCNNDDDRTTGLKRQQYL
ncbi:hypothetical protein BG004_000150 [Podila humilis]|nr:hypothetical protein BG004_000150 [Podila humilis]